ncbi:MAG: EAL domain-containing protein [Formivibrio sp.]|nr:EAL domain-containing protein [Formivibrio sp.]
MQSRLRRDQRIGPARIWHDCGGAISALSPVPHLSVLNKVEEAITYENGRAVGYFRDMRMDSCFQPIYSLPHRRIVGHEALLRAKLSDGTAVPPPQALAAARGEMEQVFVDRLCRAQHLLNYQTFDAQSDGVTWLFLNISTAVVSQRQDFGSFFMDLLNRAQFPARRVVVEILEGAVPDLALLSEAVAWYQSLGCLVALDDFGAEASNIERIWRTSPDIVKLDRTLIAAAEKSPKARRILPAIVALIHEAGSLALIEGVENAQQSAIALDCDADLAQGFHFARPAPIPLREGDGGIAATASMHLASSAVSQRSVLDPYMKAFRQAAWMLQTGFPLQDACAQLLPMARVDRCFLINETGIQMGPSLLAACNESTISRFAPLEDAEGINWSRKSYHYCALSQPGETQISRPYLSVANSRLCVTLSMAFPQGKELIVLCCDINWEE